MSVGPGKQLKAAIVGALVHARLLRPVYTFHRPSSGSAARHLYYTGDRILYARIAHNNRVMPLMSFWACFALGFYVSKLLFDERVRYYHYIYFPDRMQALDAWTKKANDKWRSFKAEHAVPDRLSLLAMYDLWRSLAATRRAEKARRREQAREALREAERQSDAAVVAAEAVHGAT